MTCPNCKNPARGNICGFCGVDAALYTRAVNMSISYYNKGLRAAEARNLHQAILDLKSGLSINKRNTQARNLLGLVYFACGRAADAMQQWMISANLQPAENPAKGYIDQCRRDRGWLEAAEKSLQLYNEALRYMQQNSEDLAIIRLRRAVEISPNFVDALNLLALAHLSVNDKTKAAAAIERVLAIDAGNAIARKYYAQVFRKKPARIPESTRKPAQKPQNTRQAAEARNYNPFGEKHKKSFGGSFTVPGILTFIIGIGCMFLFMRILIIPDITNNFEYQIYSLENELYEAREYYAAEIYWRDNDLVAQAAEIETLEGDLARTLATQAHLENEQQALMAQAHMQNGLHAAALQTLDGLDYPRLSPEMAEVYHHIRATSSPIVENDYFIEGRALFNAQNFLEARFALERAADLSHIESPNGGFIFYYLGRIAEQDGNFSLARDFYQHIINNQLRGANRINAAQQGLNRLPS